MKKSEQTQEQVVEEVQEQEVIETQPNTTKKAEILIGNEGKAGGILKQARLRQGKKIPEIAQNLCIRKAYLEAIEESQYDSIPEFPYGLGFIRSYAEYLGEDSAQIVRMYKDETSTKFNGDNKIYVLEPQVEASVPNKKYLMISLLGIIIVYCMWLGFNSYSHREVTAVPEEIKQEVTITDETQFPLVVEDFAPVEENTEVKKETMLTSDPEEKEVIKVGPVENSDNNQVVVNEGNFVEDDAKSPKKEQIEDEKTETPQAPEIAPQIGKSNIILKVKRETWVEVKNDDKLYLSKVLMPGDVYALPKADGLILSVGRLDGVDIFMGEKLINEIVKPYKKTNINLEKAIAALNH